MANYREITSIEDWSAVLEASATKQQIVFKHSTTCPVSANALNELDAYLGSHVDADADFVLVKVIESRPVSNRIAEDLNVKHESPQIIAVRNKEKHWTASHWAITNEHITAVLD
ncbi:bacillithiol system redox-active protein YtxJ [Paenibacillaceae bacterium]|nr:bacillithiol system redox-active protein YtxJ [Paenibacillaceae bacterium]